MDDIDTNEANEQPQEQQSRSPVINDNVYLAYVSVHMPRMNFKVRGAEVEVNGVTLNKNQATQPQWKLMPDRHKKSLQRFELEKNRICSRYNIPVRTRASMLEEPTGDTVDREIDELIRRVTTAADNDALPAPQDHTFYLKGCYLIPESRLDDFVEEMEQLNDELREYVRTEMASDMEQFRTSIREQLRDDEAYEEAQRHIPSGAELLAKTCIDWTPIPISLGGSREAQNANVSELRRKARARSDEFIQGVLDSVFSEPRAELVQAIKAFEELLRRDGQVTTKSLHPIRRAIEKFRSFQEMGDPEFDNLIRGLEARFTTGHLENLRVARNTDRDSAQDAAERMGLASALRDVREQAQQDTAEFQRNGRMSRGISFTVSNND
jgi:FAD/FMN-containing dehydrogenase